MRRGKQLTGGLALLLAEPEERVARLLTRDVLAELVRAQLVLVPLQLDGLVQGVHRQLHKVHVAGCEQLQQLDGVLVDWELNATQQGLKTHMNRGLEPTCEPCFGWGRLILSFRTELSSFSMCV